MTKFDGYTMDEMVDGNLHMIPNIEKGSPEYEYLLSEMRDYLSCVDSAVGKCSKHSVTPQQLQELVTAAMILYFMNCNEIYGTDEVTEGMKEVAIAVLYTALEPFNVML